MQNNKAAFTLAEVMIVFVVIGVLSAVLIPTLFQASPDTQVLKAKKAYNTLSRAVESLTNSGPYDVADGYLEATAFIHGSSDDNANSRNRLFCNNLAEILNVRSVDCTVDSLNSYVTAANCGGSFTQNDGSVNSLCAGTDSSGVVDYETLQDALDTACESFYDSTSTSDYNFQTADGVYWAIQLSNFTNDSTITSDGITSPAFYNVICIDTYKHKSSDYIYGAGIRKDGKIVVGTKLQEVVDEDSAAFSNE